LPLERSTLSAYQQLQHIRAVVPLLASPAGLAAPAAAGAGPWDGRQTVRHCCKALAAKDSRGLGPFARLHTHGEL